MWEIYHTVSSIKDALEILHKKQGRAKIIAGGTDLMLELKKDMHPEVRELVDINRVPGLDHIWEADDHIYIGPTVTHNQCLVSELLIKFGLPLVNACQSVGAAQIRNVGTIYGNLVTASPANDTISPLIGLEAEILIRSLKQERWIPLTDFYKGVRKTVLENFEMVAGLRFNKLSKNSRASFQKYLLRNVHGISVANTTVILEFEGEKIISAKITLGAVSPVIIRASDAEDFLTDKTLNEKIISQASELTKNAATPINDVRASIEYRNHLVPVLVKKALEAISNGGWRKVNNHPVLLWGKQTYKNIPTDKTFFHGSSDVIRTTINGKDYLLNSGQSGTLLDLVRNKAGLTGTKLGCGEGECGACTLHFNGVPVLSCLIPAPRAHDADIVTIEGISPEESLHPLQQSFIDEGAVQCGFCTPGFIMSGTKLLEEKPHPTEQEILEGLAGNICRCTGYYSIVRAVEKAAKVISGR